MNENRGKNNKKNVRKKVVKNPKKKKKKKKLKKKKVFSPPVICGRREWVYLENIPRRISAKLDTGAYASSLSAINIVQFEKEGVYELEKWVSFDVSHPTLQQCNNEENKDCRLHFEKKIARFGKVKNLTSENKETDLVERIYVKFDIRIGTRTRNVEVNLFSRSRFINCMILGITTINRFNFAVCPKRRLNFSQGGGCTLHTDPCNDSYLEENSNSKIHNNFYTPNPSTDISSISLKKEIRRNEIEGNDSIHKENIGSNTNVNVNNIVFENHQFDNIIVDGSKKIQKGKKKKMKKKRKIINKKKKEQKERN